MKIVIQKDLWWFILNTYCLFVIDFKLFLKLFSQLFYSIFVWSHIGWFLLYIFFWYFQFGFIYLQTFHKLSEFKFFLNCHLSDDGFCIILEVFFSFHHILFRYFIVITKQQRADSMINIWFLLIIFLLKLNDFLLSFVFLYIVHFF